jgi:RimJ/RimL family protein N-acetyltransferase
MKIKLRHVKNFDWDFILKLRNSKKNRLQMYSTTIITKKEHYDYMTKQLLNPHFIHRIICYDKKDVGYIRILENDVSIFLDEKYHGKGIGTKALKLIEKIAKNSNITKLIARIRIENIQSLKIFNKNDYQLKMYWFEKDLK